MYNQKIKDTKNEIAQLQGQLKNYEDKAQKASQAQGIEKWLDYPFESSSGLTPEYAQFAKEIKDFIKKAIAPDLILINFNRGHFYFSGFLTTPDGTKTVYFSSDDVRWNLCGGWYNSLLIRTAKHAKDYTGGTNNTCKIIDIKQKALQLINNQ